MEYLGTSEKRPNRLMVIVTRPHYSLVESIFSESHPRRGSIINFITKSHHLSYHFVELPHELGHQS